VRPKWCAALATRIAHDGLSAIELAFESEELRVREEPSFAVGAR
jgi:hypothetical protein